MLTMKESIEYLEDMKINISEDYLRHLCYKNKIPAEKKYGMYFIGKRTLNTLAKNWEEPKVGRPRGS